MRAFLSNLIPVVLLLSWGAMDEKAQSQGEPALDLSPAPQVWDEALPLGNGLLGALVWGEGDPLRISLDRTDLWDLRPVEEFHSEEYSYRLMREWVKAGRIEDLHRVYDEPYHRAGPTKIPAGRIEIALPKGTVCEGLHLPLTKPVGEMTFTGPGRGEIFVHAVEPVGMVRLSGVGGISAKLAAPPFGGQADKPDGPAISAGDLALLGYDPPREASGENWTLFHQEGWGGFSFAVVLIWKTEGEDWLATWSIATSEESEDPGSLARKRAQGVLDQGWEKARESHLEWWRDYWKRSSLQLPNPVLQKQWYLEMYKFGAAARPDTPPISLQGPWTADDGKLPPWKGDYHHDLNTELSYWPCYSANQLELGRGFVDWLWNTRENCVDWTRRFFDLPGMNVPMTADLLNRQIGGWHQYTHSSTTGSWLAHHFYLHWRHSMDREFLENRAYPYLAAVAEFLEAVSEKDAAGKRFLPLSSSPEIHDNRLEAWFPATTNYDLALMRWTLATAAELARGVGKEDRATHWESVLAEMPELALSEEDHRPLVAPGHPLHESHRHFSHLMAIHPLGLIRWENGEEDRKTIRAALAELERLGSSKWTGYSFSWLGNLAARARDGEKAEEALEIFSTAFCLRNSFHCNGDQSGKGYSDFTYRPFTLEGNFAAAAGIQEMLLQSYSGTIRVFPAIPEDWQDCQFSNHRAEGAVLVSASVSSGKVAEVRLFADTDGEVRLEDPFKESEFEVEGGSFEKVGSENALVFSLKKGDSVTLSRKD
jgi:alpha-L-fucosidase 2